MRARLIVALALALASVSTAAAGPPTDQLRDGIDRIFKILGDPEMKGDEHGSE